MFIEYDLDTKIDDGAYFPGGQKLVSCYSLFLFTVILRRRHLRGRLLISVHFRIQRFAKYGRDTYGILVST